MVGNNKPLYVIRLNADALHLHNGKGPLSSHPSQQIMETISKIDHVLGHKESLSK